MDVKCSAIYHRLDILRKFFSQKRIVLTIIAILENGRISTAMLSRIDAAILVEIHAEICRLIIQDCNVFFKRVTLGRNIYPCNPDYKKKLHKVPVNELNGRPFGSKSIGKW